MTNTNKRRQSWRIALLAAGVCCAAGAAAAPEVVASGLNNPRGLTFSPGFQLYVAESGHGGDGPCVFNPEPPNTPRCYGESGAIVRVNVWHGKDPSTSWERVLTGLPSLALPDGSRATGPVDIGFFGWDAFALMAWGGDPANRAAHLGDRGALFGTVLDVELKGLHSWGKLGFDHRRQPRKWRVVADVSAHESKNNPDAEFNSLPPDSNPNGLEVLPLRFLVADAGANVIVEAPWWQRTRTFAVFPPRCIALPVTTPPTPPGPGPGPGVGCAAGEWQVQSVPTSVTRGRHGLIYTTELTGFPFAENIARVHRLLPWGDQASPPLTGFTNTIDVAFDASGNAYVLEIGHRLVFGPPASGRLIKVDASTGARTTLETGLMFPSGIAIGPDGNAYLTDFGTSKGAGRVVRVDLP